MNICLDNDVLLNTEFTCMFLCDILSSCETNLMQALLVLKWSE